MTAVAFARELGMKSPATAADLLQAATTGRLPRRRRPALSPEQSAAKVTEREGRKQLRLGCCGFLLTLVTRDVSVDTAAEADAPRMVGARF